MCACVCMCVCVCACVCVCVKVKEVDGDKEYEGRKESVCREERNTYSHTLQTQTLLIFKYSSLDISYVTKYAIITNRTTLQFHISTFTLATISYEWRRRVREGGRRERCEGGRRECVREKGECVRLPTGLLYEYCIHASNLRSLVSKQAVSISRD